MSWVEWFSVLTAAGGVVASILGDWLTYAVRTNGAATRALIGETRSSTEALLREMQGGTAALLREMQAQTHAVLEPMDQRADERHREVVQAIQALRG